MEEGTKRNSRAWSEVYRTTAFGNAYPSDGLVSIYHHFIKKGLRGAAHPPKALDFACSHGANAKFFESLGFNVYGIDISKEAIDYCVQEQELDPEKFVACDILSGERSVKEMFGTFDLVIASECLYYFSDKDLKRLQQEFHGCMKEGAIFYANMHTWNHQLYRNYEHDGKNAEGLTEISESGTAGLPLGVRIVRDKEEMRQLFGTFQEIATVRSVLELESENETLHFIGKNAETF
ncbi:MAG: class I SAM-dependent methyltransferase [Lachnospiraceae bacterium]|nr:class I SAM-dependent methyltransferase [Lachnospiraceae bacterium]